MKIVDFTAAHIEEAAEIAHQSYERERGFVPALPPVKNMPDLTRFAKNGLGVAALEGDLMLGFLCSVPPFENAFGLIGTTGVFSPMGANGVWGALGENRAAVYARLYQTAAEKWVRAGASSHAVCLYAHDREAQDQFFRCGFGLRCADAIRELKEGAEPSPDGCDFSELGREEFFRILPLNKMLNRHMGESPTFMTYPFLTDDALLEKIQADGVRFFTARKGGEIIAYVKISDEGESAISGAPDMRNICGAYCLPEYRGTGVFQSLIHFLSYSLKREGFNRLGVDFESINPAAYGFWLKSFTAYTHSVVRRIDEGAILV